MLPSFLPSELYGYDLIKIKVMEYKNIMNVHDSPTDSQWSSTGQPRLLAVETSGRPGARGGWLGSGAGGIGGW